MKTTRLLTCDNPQEAHILKGKLNNEGIFCFITNENFSTLMPHLNDLMGGGIQIMIKEEDYEKASQIIDLNNKAIEKTHCPFCNSSNIRFGLGSNRIRKIFFIILSVLITTPFKNIKYNYYCIDCKSDFSV